jgi:tryptophan synthase beta chain
MSQTVKFVLSEDAIPHRWYNLAADLPVPLPPPLDPATHQPIGPSSRSVGIFEG